MMPSFKQTTVACAICHTPYKQKFGIPRQPNLVTLPGFIELLPPFNKTEFLNGITKHSHLWLLFWFHENFDKGYKATVRPPRLGGDKKLGVFASRSSYRPNAIGMSVVKLINIGEQNNKLGLIVEGMDLVDKTPIIDIKPYIPYADIKLDAVSSFAPTAPILKEVILNDIIKAELQSLKIPNIVENIIAILAQDPRPAYKQKRYDPKVYNVMLYNIDINWHVVGDKIVVLKIIRQNTI